MRALREYSCARTRLMRIRMRYRVRDAEEPALMLRVSTP